mmetsp:Transcript_79471/g.199770  ORF Transcript_79471/g.199770 Transcript_79471/m.199770 type:complete len:129 (+) Transcript_79471:96-482(+)
MMACHGLRSSSAAVVVVLLGLVANSSATPQPRLRGNGIDGISAALFDDDCIGGDCTGLSLVQTGALVHRNGLAGGTTEVSSAGSSSKLPIASVAVTATGDFMPANVWAPDPNGEVAIAVDGSGHLHML